MTAFESEPRLDRQIIAQVVALESVRPGLLSNLIGIFERSFDNVPRCLEALRQCGDYEQPRLAFHSLKGAAAGMGATRLSMMAGRAESIAEAKQEAVHIINAAESICTEFDAVVAALRSELDQRQNRGETD